MEGLNLFCVYWRYIGRQNIVSSHRRGHDVNLGRVSLCQYLSVILKSRVRQEIVLIGYWWPGITLFTFAEGLNCIFCKGVCCYNYFTHLYNRIRAVFALCYVVSSQYGRGWSFLRSGSGAACFVRCRIRH